MKTYINKIYLLCSFLAVFQIELFSQNKTIDGTYVGMEQEIIVIENSRFKIISNILNNRVDQNDSIIAFGSIKYHNDKFIEFNSIDYRDNVLKSTVFSELQIPEIKDSTFIRFIFPFSQKYKIELSIGSRRYKSINNSKIVVPQKIKKGESINFKIIDLDIYPEISGNYFGIVAFNYYNYKVENDNSNFISISIPELTNTFFQHYVIKGEYVRMEEGALWWRGNAYEKIWESDTP